MNWVINSYPSSLLVKLVDISALEIPLEKSEMMGLDGPQLDIALMLILLAILDWPLQPN